MKASSGWISARARLLLLMSVSLNSVLINTIPTLFVIYGITLTAFLLSRPSLRNAAFLFMLSLAAAWGFVMTQMFFYPYRPRTQLLQLIDPALPILGTLTGGVSIYLEGVLYGLVQSLRFLAMLTAGMTVVWATSPQRLLVGLRMLKLPYKMAFIVATAVRFIPVIADETRVVLTAMRMRGFPMRPSRPWQYIRALYRALPPIIFRNIRRAAVLSDSIECKGFAVRDTGIQMTEPEYDALIGRTLASVVLLTTCLVVVVKTLTFVALNGFAYFEILEGLYVFAESYL